MKIINFFNNALLLLKELWRHPQAIGAILPSSHRLTKIMAAQVCNQHQGFILEIGGGTGAITLALLEGGINPKNLIVIEQSAALARHLRRLFPEILIIEGDAAHLRQLLPPKVNCIHAIVSSLPLRSLDAAHVKIILDEFKALLPAKGKLIQYTYDIFSKNDRYMLGFTLIKTFSVWLNLPPAKVQVFEIND